MNKKFAIVLALLLISIVCCAGCIDSQDPVDPVTPIDPVDPIDPIVPVEPEVPTEEYSVMFMLNYDEAGAYTAETVKAGETVSMPANPTRSGYTFVGWFTAAEGGAEYDFTSVVNSDVMIYAQWKKNKSSGSSHSHSYSWNIVKAANCTINGQKHEICSCGDVRSTEVIPATGHSYAESTKEGQNGVLCSLCNDFQSSGVLVGNTLYSNIGDAMGAAQTEDVITLVSGVDGEIEVNKEVIIDLNGQTVTLNYNEDTPIQILRDGSENLVQVKIADETAGTGKIVYFENFEYQSEEAVLSVAAIDDTSDSNTDETDDTDDLLIVKSAIDETNKLYDVYSPAGLKEFGSGVDDGNTYEGWTITLENDINLNNVLFNPIGSYRHDKSFMGTFDGNYKTISGLSQNTWELDNGYYYTDCGLGLFGAVEEAIIKNLIIDGADISGESAICGTIAAVAHNTTFQNITIKNANVMDYQYYSGGIVGWASGICNFIDCNVDASTTVGAQWGDFDNSIGGVIGGASTSAEILMKNCIVEGRIDAYNDVTSSYRWYAYRRAGMLIGNSGATETVDGTTYASAPQLTCENVKVIYGDWANYHYCEFAGTSWPYVRCEEGVSNSAYSNPRYGHPTDANGNEVVDDNHEHNDGEDCKILCKFDQLYGGGQGVYGTATHEGVTVVYNNKCDCHPEEEITA